MQNIPADTDARDEFASVNQLEAGFYKDGFDAGFEHGKAIGIFEGRLMGQQQGYELWEEVGYYLGTAKFWHGIVLDDPAKKKAVAHITQLYALIDRFPKINDSVNPKEGMNMDDLLKQIRSKYRMTCASLGIRPRLQKAEMSM